MPIIVGLLLAIVVAAVSMILHPYGLAMPMLYLAGAACFAMMLYVTPRLVRGLACAFRSGGQERWVVAIGGLALLVGVIGTAIRWMSIVLKDPALH